MPTISGIGGNEGAFIATAFINAILDVLVAKKVISEAERLALFDDVAGELGKKAPAAAQAAADMVRRAKGI